MTRQVLIACTALLLATSAGAQTPDFVLDCHVMPYERGERIYQVSFNVDLASKSVNGHPANISETSIAMQNPKRETDTLVIDRYTGALSISRKDERIAEGRCTKVTKRQF